MRNGAVELRVKWSMEGIHRLNQRAENTMRGSEVTVGEFSERVASVVG